MKKMRSCYSTEKFICNLNAFIVCTPFTVVPPTKSMKKHEYTKLQIGILNTKVHTNFLTKRLSFPHLTTK